LNECEKLKRNLSRSQQLKLQIEGLAEGMDYSTSMSRARFEDLSDDFFRKVINFISSFIGDTPKENFEDIILIGGTCHIPRLKQLITTFFEKEPIVNINPEEAISMGTAIACKCFERDQNLNSTLTLKKNISFNRYRISRWKIHRTDPKKHTYPSKDLKNIYKHNRLTRIH